MKMYLSGGFKSGWQDDVIDRVKLMRPDAEFYDPRDHMMHDPVHWTKANLEAVADCDIIFVYQEADNPGIANNAFTIGYAHALGKKVILINQRGQRWAEMMHQVSDAFADLDGAYAALPFLKEFLS